MTRGVVLTVALAVFTQPSTALAQAKAAGASAPDTNAAAQGWSWTVEGHVFGGYNYQRREFTDFDAWESQNWAMGQAGRRIGTWQLSLSTMLSAEPLTVADIGSPQAFQTGETFHNAPLIDYQHPHDLLMQLGGELTRQSARHVVWLGAALVGSPTLGPPAFMHRPSASENPQAPLGHHYLDSTHISNSVLSGGVGTHGVRVNASLFKGQEPDENRVDLDVAAPDSGALQVAWAQGPWSAQVSSAWLTRPERLSIYDSVKRTASLAYTRADGDRLIALMAAAGQNREAHGNLEAYLVEGTWRPSWRHALYARAESVAKDILDAGFHPVGAHRHRQSRVGALTTGYVFDIARFGKSRLGLGADVTVYRVPANLTVSYGRPLSTHVFVRYHGRTGTPAAPAHHH